MASVSSRVRLDLIRHRCCRAGLVLGAALTLQACASDTRFLRDGNQIPDRQQLETDASDCRDIGPVLAGFFGGAAYGAAQGATIGVWSGGIGPAAAVGGAAGAVIGFMVGAYASADGDGFNRCMAEKGYHPAQS
jgi:hypothetical protein